MSLFYKLVEINETDQGYKQWRKSIWLSSFLFNVMVFYSLSYLGDEYNIITLSFLIKQIKTKINLMTI